MREIYEHREKKSEKAYIVVQMSVITLNNIYELQYTCEVASRHRGNRGQVTRG
jgi:hypothetical protein